MVRTKKFLVVFIIVILLLCTITGCASQNKMETSGATAASPKSSSIDDVALAFNENVSNEVAYGQYEKGGQIDESAKGIVGTGYSGASVSDTAQSATLDILSQRKVIRNANIAMEVEDFYAAYGNLQSMIKGIGYVSESNIHRDFYIYENERKTRVTGDITLRIDARHFDNILSDIKGLGEVIDDRIYSNDVTDQYFDTEGRLKMLKIEYEYYEEYMRLLTKPEDVFKTRTRMTELQTEIERLTGTLNKWNDLVQLSTIYISMTEKYPDEMTRTQNNTYWDRMANAFNRSVTGVVNALGDLLIFIIEAVPTLVVLAFFAWVAYRIVKMLIEKKKSNTPVKTAHSAKTNLETKLEQGDVVKPDCSD